MADTTLPHTPEADETPEMEPASNAPVPAFTKHRWRASSWAWWEMLTSSLLGLIASFVLSIDAIKLAENPDAILSCNINAKISCGTVGASWQASLLGFPNAFLGLISEPVVITVAVAALAGVRFPRWFMLLAQTIYAIGFGFALWLFYEAYFVIGALCPWCLLITVTTTLVFVSMTRVNILEGNFGETIRVKGGRLLTYGLDIAGVVVLFAIIAAMIYVRYL
jgi:uncharacterized membrane protein